MNPGLRRLLLAWLLSLCGAAAAADLQPVPAQVGLLVDQMGVLDEAAWKSLSARLQAFQDAGRAQVAVLVAEDIGDEPLAEFSLRVAQAWGIGRAPKDDGLLIVLVPARKAVRIEVGYGLEGTVPDVLAARWLDEALPAVKAGDAATALSLLLDRIDQKLPKEAPSSSRDSNYLFPDHPEWRLPFVLVVFSPFAIFPLFAGRVGAWASALLLAGFWGSAAWMLWDSRPAGMAAAALAFPLPLCWSLHARDDDRLAPWQRGAKTVGSMAAVLLFFGVITLFVGAGLKAAGEGFVWGAPVFAGILAMGLAAFLFPSRAQVLLVVLRSVMQFVFVGVVAHVSLMAFVPEPLRLALLVAGVITTLIAIGLFLDSREGSDAAAVGRRWSVWFFALAVLLVLPFGLLALILAAGGEDARMRLVQAAAGSGSIAAVLALAAKYGLVAAVRVGLGGLFGGGGAQRGG
jgi:uncharacterized protein